MGYSIQIISCALPLLYVREVIVMKLSGYEATDDGHVLDTKTGNIIKEFKSNKYLQCQVYDDEGVPHVFGVHQVIARLRCSTWFDGCIVHHKDENPHNNRPDNLECYSRRAHSSYHMQQPERKNRLSEYVKHNGPANKGKKMSEEFRKHCSESAKQRGFNGNQYIDKYGHRKS